MSHQKLRYLPARTQLIGLLMVLIAAVVVLPQIGGFRESLHLLKHLQPSWVAVAIMLTLATYAAAGGTYYYLAFKPLRYARTVVAQFAAMFTNRLLPSGVGAVGANYAYLHANKQTVTQAATMVTMNNLFGLLGHALVVSVTLVFFGQNLPSLMTPHTTASWLPFVAGSAVLGAIVLLALPKMRHAFVKIAHDVAAQINAYRRRPGRLVAALTSSTLLTVCNMLSLYACVLAVGGHASFAVVCIVFTFGIGASTAIPTPGGLGGFEAGLLAGFIGYNLPHATALAAVVLYRLISYWFTLVLGAGAFAYASRQGYYKRSKR